MRVVRFGAPACCTLVRAPRLLVETLGRTDELACRKRTREPECRALTGVFLRGREPRPAVVCAGCLAENAFFVAE
eukprot:6140945-Alexandrium_andersonii.AAC.1